MSEVDALLGTRRGAMVAPAGCGKTHLIATAISRNEAGRSLILTHTHAGVDALRSRLRSTGVSTGSFSIDTIAGWALRYASSYPTSTGVRVGEKPASNDEWNKVYPSATKLLEGGHIRDVIQASYPGGVFVDEYQDCIVEQHQLMLALSNAVPCRVLGDPLQGIFDFGNNTVVSWPEHVEPHFESLDGPVTPYRWLNTNMELGQWLQQVRTNLEKGQPIDLGELPNGVQHVQLEHNAGLRAQQQRSACLEALNHRGESVVVIQQWAGQCHSMGKTLKGTFSCAEPVECKELLDSAEKIGAATGPERVRAVVNFAGLCMTKAASQFKSLPDKLAGGQTLRSKKYAGQIAALRAVANSVCCSPVATALESLEAVEGANVYRRELIREMKRAAVEFGTGEHKTLADAAWEARSRTRVIGRPVVKRCLGRTLLVKGLEFDHAIILDADSLDRKNLYVAMTRGAKTLTILSSNTVLAPK
jgi:hypothetical protein